METNETAKFYLELIKAHMNRFDYTRKIQWTFNSFFWAGILITAPVLKNSKYEPSCVFIFYIFLIWLAYSIVMYLFQYSLNWDKNKFKDYRKILEQIIGYSEKTDNRRWKGNTIWIIMQSVVTFLLLSGVYLFLKLN